VGIRVVTSTSTNCLSRLTFSLHRVHSAPTKVVCRELSVLVLDAALAIVVNERAASGASTSVSAE
jgi:hypothetical protein